MEELKIIPAPLALKPRIEALSGQTAQEHRARQPHLFAKNFEEAMLGPIFGAAFRDMETRRGLPESPVIWVAMRGDEMLGYILLSPEADPRVPGPKSVSVSDICVVPEARRQGVSQALLAHVKALADAGDWDHLTAQIWDGNSASAAAFRAAGFHPQRQEFRYGPDRPARDITHTRGSWQTWPAWIVFPLGFGLGAFATLILANIIR